MKNKWLAGWVVRFRYVRKAIAAINSPHISDIVEYKGKEHQLIQGIASPYWDLLDLSPENLAKSPRDIERHVHMNDFNLQPLYKRFWFSFRFTYRFYMMNWFSIERDQLVHKNDKP